MTRSRSGPLAAWTSAWLAGRVGPDQVVDAVTGADAPHRVSGLAGNAMELVPLHALLLAWRRAGGTVRVVFPVAGDVRGVPGPDPFRSAALDAGEAVCGPGIGVVPEVTEYWPSSAPPSVRWQAFAVDPQPLDYLDLGDAQYELATTIREAASALSAADVADWPADVSAALRDARRAGESPNLPPGFPQRAIALLAQAERLEAVLDLAAQHRTGGAVDRTGIAARREALRLLAAAVRRARLAGYNAGAEQ